MKLKDATDQIEAVFGRYKTLTAADTAQLATLKEEKAYELFVLSELLKDLRRRGFKIGFKGTSLKFKAGPGMIIPSDPHFEVRTPAGTLFIFVDIEFRSLGSTHRTVTDNSGKHELDIVIVDRLDPYPAHESTYLGVECKAGKFEKVLLKQILGVRRELSYFSEVARRSRLTLSGALHSVLVHAWPPSEFWVACLDPKATGYAQSPKAFGIDFMHLEPPQS